MTLFTNLIIGAIVLIFAGIILWYWIRRYGDAVHDGSVYHKVGGFLKRDAQQTWEDVKSIKSGIVERNERLKKLGIEAKEAKLSLQTLERERLTESKQQYIAQLQELSRQFFKLMEQNQKEQAFEFGKRMYNLLEAIRLLSVDEMNKINKEDLPRMLQLMQDFKTNIAALAKEWDVQKKIQSKKSELIEGTEKEIDRVNKECLDACTNILKSLKQLLIRSSNQKSLAEKAQALFRSGKYGKKSAKLVGYTQDITKEENKRRQELQNIQEYEKKWNAKEQELRALYGRLNQAEEAEATDLEQFIPKVA